MSPSLSLFQMFKTVHNVFEIVQKNMFKIEQKINFII